MRMPGVMFRPLTDLQALLGSSASRSCPPAVAPVSAVPPATAPAASAAAATSAAPLATVATASAASAAAATSTAPANLAAAAPPAATAASPATAPAVPAAAATTTADAAAPNSELYALLNYTLPVFTVLSVLLFVGASTVVGHVIGNGSGPLGVALSIYFAMLYVIQILDVPTKKLQLFMGMWRADSKIKISFALLFAFIFTSVHFTIIYNLKVQDYLGPGIYLLGIATALTNMILGADNVEKAIGGYGIMCKLMPPKRDDRRHHAD